MINYYSRFGLANQIWSYAEIRFYCEKHGLALRYGGHYDEGRYRSHEQIYYLPQLFDFVDWPIGKVIEGHPQDMATLGTPAEQFLVSKYLPKRPINWQVCTFKTYWLPPMEKLKQWLHPRFSIAKTDTNVIHIRLGDMLFDGYHYHESNPSLNRLRFFYKAAIKQLDLSKPTEIVTDDRNHPLVQNIAEQFSIPLSTHSAAEDWFKAVRASTLVCHYRSTFAFWASRWSDNQDVITCWQEQPSPINIKAEDRIWMID